ncbi:pyrroline-5-carboxylate reductase [Legionella jordanis]|uniref:Pyrroline-5-carboxylate reductase n=1 Tax=Legionella jordanis TaxID=456 RepID=A0A0W0V9F0_9GAMM|nr:pyrroline-5-carboxylate reductase [Legionella jordanis]KTD16748.1 pyrroline-5-carboxylate reductase [Legionella jordanis]RMX03724.1 pyrroline-5-carboxylate reductase [Legionella jordanis]VEH11784.1 pyrroline-5-carboxylate reductase [Legionella jordanis]HAT8712906.1 pyrroline-5-carboxylate reductase [Legionella jordanis]
MKISFIGYGNLAKAMAHRLQQGANYQLFASAPSLQEGKHSDGISTTSDNEKIIQDANVIILAVKPAKVAEVLNKIGRKLPANSLLISVAAGITMATLQKYCNENQAIIRSMPNTPVALGLGAIPLFANLKVNQAQKQLAEQLFTELGLIHWAASDHEINRFTALSGSGPAYVFLFMEAMIQASQTLGLDAEIAKTFTTQTVKGALALAEESPLSFTELREKVTSAKGTTAAALEVLMNNHFSALIKTAMQAAYERANELSQ